MTLYLTIFFIIIALLSGISFSAKGYALVRHACKDIRFAVQRSLIYSMLLGILIGLYAALIIGSELFFHVSLDARTFIAAGITTMAGVFGVPFIERTFRKITDPIFFKHPYIYSVELERLSEILNKNLDVDEIILQSLQELNRILKLTSLFFFHQRSGTCFDASGKLSKATCEKAAPVIIRVPIESEEVYFGVILLGSKRSGDRYTQEDKRLLRTFARHATIALHKAELYQELKEHTELLEKRVFERTQHLEVLQENQREFFDDVSHALQTPLTILKSALELMGNTTTIPHTRLSESMQTSVDDMSRLIRNMLELARIDTRSPITLYAPFDISCLVRRTLEYVGVTAHARGILISSEIEEGIIIQGEERQIEELLTNILSNAVRYTAGCPIRTMHITLASIGTMVSLCITDSGIGIREEHLTHIFDRFYRSEPINGKAQGFGLGLAIAKRIADRHNGSLGITSTFGVGTTVQISLPFSGESPLLA